MNGFSSFKYHYENNSLYDLSTKLICKNSYQIPILTSITITSTVGEATGPIIKKGKWTPTIKKQKKSTEDQYLIVKKALSLLTATTVDERKYKVSRPSLGVRSGKLAAYRVTLQNQKMFFFLERFLEAALHSQKKLGVKKNSLHSGVIDSKLIGRKDEFEYFVLKEVTQPKKTKNTGFINDGSINKKVIQTYFDGNGNYHYGIPSFFLFREIEQNPEFELLKNHGFSVTIKTTAKNDQEARLLLSSWGFPWSTKS